MLLIFTEPTGHCVAVLFLSANEELDCVLQVNKRTFKMLFYVLCKQKYSHRLKVCHLSENMSLIYKYEFLLSG